MVQAKAIFYPDGNQSAAKDARFAGTESTTAGVSVTLQPSGSITHLG